MAPDYSFQSDLIDRTSAEYAKGAECVCMQAPTGGGKTAMAITIIKRSRVRRASTRVIFAAHLFAILDSTVTRARSEGMHVGVIQSGEPADATAPLQIASLGTLWSMMSRGVPLPPCDLFILDEAHRARARTIDAIARALMAANPRCRLLWLTATPARGDNQGLGRSSGGLCDALVCGPSPRDLQQRGVLVPFRVICPSHRRESGIEMDPVEAYHTYMPGRRAIVFARDQAHARDVAGRFGPDARLVLGGEGDLDQRRASIDAVRDSPSGVLVTVRALAEGLDVPGIDGVITTHKLETSVAGYLQQPGRGARASAGKSDCVFVDLTGATYVWGLPDIDRVWSLNGEACAAGGRAAGLCTCEKCHAVFEPDDVCPVCGAEVISAARIVKVVKNGELIELDVSQALHIAMEWLRIAAKTRGRGVTETEAMGAALADSPPWVKGVIEKWEDA